MCHTAFAAFPFPYSKACDTSRPRIGQCAAIRAGLGGKAFVHFHVPCAMPHGLVRQHPAERRPACIKHGLRQAGLGESTGIDIANSNMVEGAGKLHRPVMQEVQPAPRRACLNGSDAAPLVGSLRNCQRRFSLTIKARHRNLFSLGRCSEILQAKINTDTVVQWSDRRLSYLDHNIEEPIAPTVLRKATAVLDLPFRKRARVKHAERITCKAKRVAFPMQVASFERNPAQGLSAAVAQIRPAVLGTRSGELFAHSIDHTRVQLQFFAAAGSQLVQVKAGQPRALKPQGILLPVIAVVPDEIHLTGLLIKQPVFRFHTEAVDKNHTVILYSISLISRRTAALRPGPFTPRPEGRGFSEQV